MEKYYKYVEVVTEVREYTLAFDKTPTTIEEVRNQAYTKEPRIKYGEVEETTFYDEHGFEVDLD